MSNINSTGNPLSGAAEVVQRGQAEMAGRNREPMTPPSVGVGNVQPIYTGKDMYPTAPRSGK